MSCYGSVGGAYHRPGGLGSGFALIVVLFILLVIVGTGFATTG
jgi:uncharacterized protein (TIGR01732 family)